MKNEIIRLRINYEQGLGNNIIILEYVYMDSEIILEKI